MPATDRRVAEVEGGGWAVQDWSPDDRALLVTESFSVNHSRLWRLDLATGERTLLTPDPPGDTVARGPRARGPDGRGVYLTRTRTASSAGWRTRTWRAGG